jgi:hypothetical protein
MVPEAAVPGLPGDLTPQLTAVEIGTLLVVVTKSVNCTVPLTWRSSAVGLTETLTGGGVTVTVIVLEMELLATLVAVKVTGLGEGGTWGAVYRPVGEIVPTEELPPTMPSTAHVTAVLLTPVTVAVNCCVPVTCTVAVFTFTARVRLMRTGVETDLEVSAWLVAVMLTDAGEGTSEGAV